MCVVYHVIAKCKCQVRVSLIRFIGSIQRQRQRHRQRAEAEAKAAVTF